MGCFSFDPVKTITCGEGGAIVTNDSRLYELSHAFSDHGHDHIGNDRGAEDHPILGYNYRISELNAAVGLAQLRKLDDILDKQRAHKKALKEAMAGLPGVEFRRLPDEKGDSATFLSFMFPDEQKARESAAALNGAGVDGSFYWYDNNWHYLRKWHHLKKMRRAAKLPIETYADAPNYDSIELPQSDNIMARTVSMQIKLAWSEQDIQKRIAAIQEILGKRQNTCEASNR
jgi:8-amino-3,8-dideoxy-alpha-D-manno-octulosonate transaminase